MQRKRVCPNIKIKNYTVNINKLNHKRKEEIPMKNKYLFDQSKETLLKNTELNVAEALKERLA